MKIFDSTSNMSSQLVTTDLHALEFRVKKTTAAATLGDFFGTDTLQITYNSQGRQENICPTQPVAMLAYFATMHNGSIKAIYGTGTDATKIAEVHFRIDVGFGGSISLSDNKQLLISTNFSGISDLKCYAICTGKNVGVDGKESPIAVLCYDYINLESGNFKNLDISQATALVMTTSEKDVNISDRTGNSYIQSVEALQAISSAINEVAVLFGTKPADKYSISGELVSTNVTMFKATEVEPGGARYIGFGVSPYQSIKIKSTKSDGLLMVTPKIL